MASPDDHYPDHLNPFGDDEDDKGTHTTSAVDKSISNSYPDHLDPFGDEDPAIEDYDDSLNPFGLENTTPVEPLNNENTERHDEQETHSGANNPFSNERDQQGAVVDVPALSVAEQVPDASMTQSLDSLEPPKPLPRTKSLLKKEQHKKRLEALEQSKNDLNNQMHSIPSTASLTTSSSSTTAKTGVSITDPAAVSTSQPRKNKRIAPPVPINFKREVRGSLEAIEEELNDIGNKLALMDKESTICQKALSSPDTTDESDQKTTKSKYIELIKRQNSIVRRQKELMYKKRELKLDQLHSDIEYELRMIGNKQVSTRTPEDEVKEKELLKRLVDIVEEKSDIVENLNKDTICDNHDIEEAFKRLNIVDYTPDKVNSEPDKNHSAKTLPKKDGCDKGSRVKLSKIATLLPKGNTIKLKRKKLFKRIQDSRSIES